jgi:hypothetical protein
MELAHPALEGSVAVRSRQRKRILKVHFVG